jgi:hypothetical protein
MKRMMKKRRKKENMTGAGPLLEENGTHAF